MRTSLSFVLIFLLVSGCDKAVNSYTIKVYNRLNKQITVNYGNTRGGTSINSINVEPNEKITLKHKKDYNFLDSRECNFFNAIDVIDTMSVFIDTFKTKKNIMQYEYESLFTCEPDKKRSPGNVNYILNVDERIYE